MKIKKTDLLKLNESLKKWVKLTENLDVENPTEEDELNEDISELNREDDKNTKNLQNVSREAKKKATPYNPLKFLVNRHNRACDRVKNLLFKEFKGEASTNITITNSSIIDGKFVQPADGYYRITLELQFSNKKGFFGKAFSGRISNVFSKSMSLGVKGLKEYIKTMVGPQTESKITEDTVFNYVPNDSIFTKKFSKIGFVVYLKGTPITNSSSEQSSSHSTNTSVSIKPQSRPKPIKKSQPKAITKKSKQPKATKTKKST